MKNVCVGTLERQRRAGGTPQDSIVPRQQQSILTPPLANEQTCAWM